MRSARRAADDPLRSILAASDTYPVPIKRVGIADRFAETGPYFEMLDLYGMAVGDIAAAARQVLALRDESRLFPAIIK